VGPLELKVSIVHKRKKRHALDCTDDEASDFSERESKVNRRRKCYSTARKPWSVEKLHLLMGAFAKDISAGKVPGYGVIETMQKKHPVLRQRSHEQIRARVWHEVRKHRR